jgi:hypothetical protein
MDAETKARLDEKASKLTVQIESLEAEKKRTAKEFKEDIDGLKLQRAQILLQLYPLGQPETED